METRNNPKEGKLLYHLTTMDNIKNIIEKGLLPRSELTKGRETFKDTANSEILSRRKEQSLDEYVPFHFFVKILMMAGSLGITQILNLFTLL